MNRLYRKPSVASAYHEPFKSTLLCIETEGPRPDGPGATGPARRPLRLLLVDDEPLLLKSHVRFLSSPRSGGNQCETASDGKEALDRYTAALRSGAPYDAVVTDLDMPNMKGDELLVSIRSLNQTAVVIIVSGGITGDGISEAERSAYRQKGAAAVFPKPVNYNYLCDAIYAAMQ